MIAVIDYDTGNLRSVENALRRLGREYTVTDDEKTIRAASHVLLPGVGEAATAMAKLRERGLDEAIRSLTQPVLGICIGLQLMCGSSEEGGGVQCMGIFDAAVRKFRASPALKVPHMGWDTVERQRTALFDGVAQGAYLYYVHSYAPDVCADTIAVTDYGAPFSAAIGKGNFFGTQFHPEKSGVTGEKILRNFLAMR